MQLKHLWIFLWTFLSFINSIDVAVAADTTRPAPLPFLSPMFSDEMVLQRGKPNTFWGWANPGEKITVTIADQSANAIADDDGRWQVKIAPPPVGGPYVVKIAGPQNVELHDVLVGDVWLCGGQSNMELGLSRVRNAEDEIKAANYPNVRFYRVKQHTAYSRTLLPDGVWKACSPTTVAEGGSGFSAVAYFFGTTLNNKLHVPIGLIQDCVGGTTAETWMNPDTLRTIKDFIPKMAEMDRLRQYGGAEYGNYIMPWYDQYDIGLKGGTWAATDLDDSSWKTVTIPGGFTDLGLPDSPAVCWFRREITLPDPIPAGQSFIFLGSVERMDTVYINKHWIGASAWVENPRVYAIPPGVLKPGRNVLAIRVFKVKPVGGFLSPASVLRLALADKTAIPLAGQWKGAISVDARPPHPLPVSFENWPSIPSVLYNGMIAPLAPLALTGAIWYQGEANAERAYQYRTVLPVMIADWRKLFDQGDFPFYIVSLPAFMHHKDAPGTDEWAEMRESQAVVARDVPNSGLAITIDTGEPDNIHPKDKRIVGERLALCALAQQYSQNVPYRGPTYKSFEYIGNALKIHFDNTDGGLTVKGADLKEFSLAGNDHKWHWADAKIDGDTIIVSSPDVPAPQAARYAWQANPLATLYNAAGLPAVPFRTDDWPGVTDGRTK